jgi:hypothetical protein
MEPFLQQTHVLIPFDEIQNNASVVNFDDN